MYSVKPIGLNLKDNDRDVPDGSLQESINMQWRDGAFKPIPERIISAINVAGYKNVFFHKVGDENQINVLGFNEGGGSGTFLAFDLAGYLGGDATGGNILEWFGTITNGVYTTRTVTQIPLVRTPGMSFTILNGLIYFMGDGSTLAEQFYAKLEYNDSDGVYTLYNMYAWKELIPYYPFQGNVNISAPNKTHNVLSVCGVVLVRFALVLKTGEVVLHSPIYAVNIYGLNRSDDAIAKDDLIKNIHAVINMNLEFKDNTLYDSEISAINVYASIPFYETKLPSDVSLTYEQKYVYTAGIHTIADLAEQPFYMIKTISKPTTDKIILKAGNFDTDIVFDFGTDYDKIDMDTIAAGEIMPVDNFSYHKIYGRITSYNGRLVVKRPVTVLSGGHFRALAVADTVSKQAFSIKTEDGDQEQVFSLTDKSVFESSRGLESRGMLSYPDYRAFNIGSNALSETLTRFWNCRKNASHNLSCSFDYTMGYNTYDVTSVMELVVDPIEPTNLKATVVYDIKFTYAIAAFGISTAVTLKTALYSSENRMQFSEAGEFKVWPVLNSYRIGEGRIMNLGTGSVNPSESQVISPLIVGTSDGIYTINLDPMGNNFIASITKTKHIPMISEEILEIDNNILFISDQGLMVFSNGDIQNLTEAYFPQQGNGNFPAQQDIYPGYDLMTYSFFGSDGNIYELDDIVTYLRGALLAFDGRRNNIWCSNPTYKFSHPTYKFSLVYNLITRQWGMSTLVFNEKQELFSIMETGEGEIYSRYMIKSPSINNLLILSGEDPSKEVFYHIMTRPIKFNQIDDYKVLPRMISRCLLIRDTSEGYFSIGIWGQQEVNRYRKSLPLALKKDDRTEIFPDGIRYHLPIDCRKGKYKTVTVVQTGKALPDSYVSSFDFDIYIVDNNRMR